MSSQFSYNLILNLIWINNQVKKFSSFFLNFVFKFFSLISIISAMFTFKFELEKKLFLKLFMLILLFYLILLFLVQIS